MPSCRARSSSSSCLAVDFAQYCCSFLVLRLGVGALVLQALAVVGTALHEPLARLLDRGAHRFDHELLRL
jgi:hypothetical protein